VLVAISDKKITHVAVMGHRRHTAVLCSTFLSYHTVVCASCHQQAHVGSKTLLKQDPFVLNHGAG